MWLDVLISSLSPVLSFWQEYRQGKCRLFCRCVRLSRKEPHQHGWLMAHVVVPCEKLNRKCSDHSSYTSVIARDSYHKLSMGAR